MADSDTVTIRDEFGFEKDVHKDAVKFFPNHVVLDASGRVNTRATSAAATNQEK